MLYYIYIYISAVQTILQLFIPFYPVKHIPIRDQYIHDVEDSSETVITTGTEQHTIHDKQWPSSMGRGMLEICQGFQQFSSLELFLSYSRFAIHNSALVVFYCHNNLCSRGNVACCSKLLILMKKQFSGFKYFIKFSI